MAMFQHPHLTRGVVTTSRGSFVVSRGLVSAPDEIGESLGWRRVDVERDLQTKVARRDRSAGRDPGMSMDRQ
jgi:hypothetical protein